MTVWHPIFEETLDEPGRQQIIKEAQKHLATKSGKLRGLEQQLPTDVPKSADFFYAVAMEMLKQRSFKWKDTDDQWVDVDSDACHSCNCRIQVGCDHCTNECDKKHRHANFSHNSNGEPRLVFDMFAKAVSNSSKSTQEIAAK